MASNVTLFARASMIFLPKFDPDAILKLMARATVMMGVPTFYTRLLQNPGLNKDVTRHMRLFISGSAPLLADTHREWSARTGHAVLERYGMTELGMALSNPYEGERRPGHVGQPLPGVVIKRVDESRDEVTDASTPGELAVKSPTAFREYWGNPESTAKAFADGWFLTGDIAVIEDGAYRILGRASIDIIKSGGYKLSALEIEATLLEHPDVSEVAVIGIPDDEWGELVACALVVSQPLSDDALTAWARERMSGYKVPRRWHFTETLPRNALGKVTKPSLKSWF